MVDVGNPGALARATGGELPCYAVAAGIPNIASDAPGINARLKLWLAPIVATDPAALAALGLVAVRLWGAAP